MKVLKQRNCSVLANQMRKLEMRQNKNCLPSGGGTNKALSAVHHDFQLENQNMKDLSGGKKCYKRNMGNLTQNLKAMKQQTDGKRERERETVDNPFNARVKNKKPAKKTCKRRGTGGRGGPLTLENFLCFVHEQYDRFTPHGIVA